MNFNTQYFKGIPLTLINRNYKNYKAMRFVINNTNQNIWIPKVYLEADGTIKPHISLDFIFKHGQVKRKLELAGVTMNE